jgi:hypothetical protein
LKAVVRWQVKLSEFEIKIMQVNGEEHMLADGMSMNATEMDSSRRTMVRGLVFTSYGR